MLAAFGINDAPAPDLARWDQITHAIAKHEGEVTIAIVGKYTGLKDAYKSLVEALHHGGIANTVKVNLEWIEADTLETAARRRASIWVDGILVPGGFGQRGSEGMITAAGFAREHNVPFFGICFGMQLAMVEATRHLAGLEKASSSEFGPTPDPVVGLMTEWLRGNQLEKRNAGGDLGGTMRLGAYPAMLQRGSRIADIYGATEISERHRHRYEININYRDRLEQHGLRFAGMSPDGLLPETVELEGHPWFIGVQYHPELKSRPFEPHPLFASFIAAHVIIASEPEGRPHYDHLLAGLFLRGASADESFPVARLSIVAAVVAVAESAGDDCAASLASQAMTASPAASGAPAWSASILTKALSGFFWQFKEAAAVMPWLDPCSRQRQDPECRSLPARPASQT